MKKLHLKKGFTLIELLVVIAIIGVLASVILAVLNSARSKGSDSNIKANLSGARSQAELFAIANGYSYSTVCTNVTVSGVKSIFDQIQSASKAAGLAGFTYNGTGAAGVATCNDSANGWAAEVPVKNPSAGFWCVDNNGKSQFESVTSLATLPSGSDTSCI